MGRKKGLALPTIAKFFSESKELARPSRSEKRDIRVEDDEQDFQMALGEVARPVIAKAVSPWNDNDE